MNRLLMIFVSVFIVSISSLAQKIATIGGTIRNSKSDTIRIYVSDDFIGQSIEYKGRIGSQGEFKLIIPLSEPKAAILQTGKDNIPLFISPDDTIHCQYNLDSVMSSIKFLGNRADQYNYFIKYYQIFNVHHAMFFKPDFSDAFEMSPDKFKEYRKHKVEKDLIFLNNYCSNSSSVTNQFKIYAEVEIRYSYYYALLSYASIRKYFKKIEDKLPSDFYLDINKNLFRKDEYLFSENYVNAMKMYMSEILVGSYTDANVFYPKAINISSQVLSGKSLYLYQTKILVELLRSDAQEVLKDSLINQFLNVCPHNEYNRAITLAYKISRKADENLIPREVREAVLITKEDKVLSFGNVLSKNKGYVLYIDIWASFCGPCKIEMPYSRKLNDRFQGKPVKFIYLSIDSKTDSWERAIDNWKIDGENYLIRDQLSSSFCKHFNIIGVPHYILIDKKGNVIFPFAARPSSLSIESAINSLIME